MTNENSIESLLREYGLPQMFGYNSLVCWCKDLKRDGTSVSFLAKFAKPDGHISVDKYIEIIPGDLFFKILVAAYYGISATSVSVQLLIDEDTGDAPMTITVNGAWAKDYVTMLNNSIYLFVSNAARGSNVLNRCSVADVIPNIEVADASGTMQSLDVECTLDTTIRRAYAATEALWFRAPYGISCSFSCSNYSKVDDAVKDYRVSSCQRVLYRCTEELSKRLGDLKAILDPTETLKIGFRVRPAVMSVTRSTIEINLIAEPTFVRQFEICDCFQGGIVRRPRGNTIRLPHGDDIDHSVGDVMTARLATQILSAPGNLYVPKSINRNFRWEEGFELIDNYFEPHLASFGSPTTYFWPQNFTRPDLSEYWMPFDIVPGKIQGLAPINITPSDPQVLIYGRIDRDFMASPRGRMTTYTALCSKDVRPYAIWSDGSWQYFALLDRTIDFDSRSPELYGDPVFQPLFTSSGFDRDDNSVIFLNIIYGLMESSNIDAAIDSMDDDTYDAAMEKAQDEEIAIVGVWAAAVDMANRYGLFKDYYQAFQRAITGREIDHQRSDLKLQSLVAEATGQKIDVPRETIDLTEDEPTVKPTEPESTVKPPETDSVDTVPEKKPGTLRSFFDGLFDGLFEGLKG